MGLGRHADVHRQVSIGIRGRRDGGAAEVRVIGHATGFEGRTGAMDAHIRSVGGHAHPDARGLQMQVVVPIEVGGVLSDEDVRAGEMKAIGFLTGQVMKITAGKANPGVVQAIIKKLLSLS